MYQSIYQGDDTLHTSVSSPPISIMKMEPSTSVTLRHTSPTDTCIQSTEIPQRQSPGKLEKQNNWKI